MLAITVREGEYILIGDNIKIKIVKGSEKSVIGIDAPRNIPVLRQAVHERNRGAVQDREIRTVDDL